MAQNYDISLLSNSFLKKYYTIISSTPQNLHTLYTDDGTFTWEGVTKKITDDIEIDNLKDAYFNYSQGLIDAQFLDENQERLLLIVSGTYLSIGSPLIHFTQTFILVSTKDSVNENYVDNPTSHFKISSSIFRCLNNLFGPSKMGSEFGYSLPLSPIPHHSNRMHLGLIPPMVPAGFIDPIGMSPTSPPPSFRGHVFPHFHKMEPSYIPHTLSPNAAPFRASITPPIPIIAPETAPARSIDSESDGLTDTSEDNKIPNSKKNEDGKLFDNKTNKSNEKKNQNNHKKNNSRVKDNNIQYPTVYVASLVKEDSSEEIISEAFSQFGEVIQVDFMRGKNYAFVKFSTQEAVNKALAMNGQVKVGGHIVKVMERTINNKNNNTPSPSSVAPPPPIPSLISSENSSNNSHNSNSNNLPSNSNPLPPSSPASSPTKSKTKNNQNSKKVSIVSN